MKSEGVFDCIELALESEWSAEDEESVPDELKDALTMMERGRRLLREGLKIPASFVNETTADEEYRAAARNGETITEDVFARMHKEREVSELEAAKG